MPDVVKLRFKNKPVWLIFNLLGNQIFSKHRNNLKEKISYLLHRIPLGFIIGGLSIMLLRKYKFCLIGKSISLYN
jgi:hypothetical protein